jgi:predicted ATPase
MAETAARRELTVNFQLLNEIMPDETLTRLDWSSDYFGGREQEVELLQSSLKWRNGHQRCRIFFIQGESGIGKSSLVERAFRDEKMTTPSVLAKAKFDDSHATAPLQAWIDATESILLELEHDNDFRIHLYKSFQQSSERSADHLSILTSVLGDRLRKLFEDRPKNYRSMVASKKSQQSFRSMAASLDVSESSIRTVDSSSMNTATGLGASAAEKDHGFERLKVAYRELYRVICKFIPVVLFLDDMQWGEPDDFKIMGTMLDDPELEDRLIFVGAHRPVQMLHGLNLLKRPTQRDIKTIMLTPLSPYEIAQSLSKLLRQDENDVLELTRAIDQKTGGHPFFMRQFLQALEECGILQYSPTNSQWEWDSKRIQKETSIGDNVLEIVSKKIGELPQLGKVLSLAAFLGSSRIYVTILIWILEEETDEVGSEEQLQNVLKEAVDMGFIDRIGRKEYRFAHDLIRESALMLLPSGQSLDKMHMRVGLRLRSLWGKNPTNDRLLFQMVTQLNGGYSLIKTPKERFKLAQLNFRAAEAAMKRSAFYPAINFLRRTKEILANDSFAFDITDFALMTETALARMEFCCGFLDKCITRTDAIIKIASDDKVKAEAMHLKAKCFIQQKKPMECLEVSIVALATFGVHYPRKLVKLHVLRMYTKAKKLLKNLSDDDILNLPGAKKERYQLASECLPWISEMAISYGLDEHVACSMLTAVELSIEKGRNSMTSQTLAAWGAILSEEGEISEAYRFGQLAMKLAEDRIGETLDDRVPALYYSRLHHLRHPFADGVEPYSKALKNLWARGALEGVVADTSGYLRLYYVAGLKLKPLLEDMYQFRTLCTDFGMTIARSLIDPFAQMISNLVDGPSEDMLRGDFMMETKSIRFWQQNNSNIGIQLYYFHKMVVAYFFNSYNLAGKLATKVTHMYLEGADNLVPYRFFFRALAAWTIYGTTKKLRYRKLARKMTAGVQKLVDAGVQNCNHSLLFLQAERAAALCSRGRNRESVQKAYDDAISAATEGGFMYDRALANERAGQYFIKISDKTWASTYLISAQGCYLDWEANAKAKQMVREYGVLLGEGNRLRISQASSSSSSSPRNSRARLKTLESVEFDESSADASLTL